MTGQGPVQLAELGLAFLLSALLGLEREWRRKAAGLRTYTLIGVSSALFMLVSKYGFSDVLADGRVVLDPSRVAAQIVSGIGFVGGGVIFMRRDVVRGLTTAASIWLAAALGMACGAGLPVLAIATTLIHFTIMLGFPRLVRALPRRSPAASRLRIRYRDGQGLLRAILVAVTEGRFSVENVEVERARDAAPREQAIDAADDEGTDPPALSDRGVVQLSLRLKGRRPVEAIVASLAEMDGVLAVRSGDDETELEEA